MLVALCTLQHTISITQDTEKYYVSTVQYINKLLTQYTNTISQDTDV